MRRMAMLAGGALVLAMTATKALGHMVMVPAERPEQWISALFVGLFLMGWALMPRGE